MRSAGSGLALELFAWWCATGDTAGTADQLAIAEAGFGQEERWPRLFTSSSGSPHATALRCVAKRTAAGQFPTARSRASTAW